MIGVMWAKGSRPLKGKRDVGCAFDEREREIVMNVVRVSSPVDSFLFFLPPRGSPGTSVCLSVELGQDAEAVGKGGEGRGRRKATAAVVGERRMT